jgi:hypothetical protein
MEPMMAIMRNESMENPKGEPMAVETALSWAAAMAID